MRFLMWPKLAAAAAAAIVALGGAAPAAAAVLFYTYKGTVGAAIGDGFDNTGLFGAGRDLRGLAFTAVFRVDGGMGRTSGYYASNPVRASLTIGGGSAVTFGDGLGQQVQYPSFGGVEAFRHLAEDELGHRVSQLKIDISGPNVGDYLSNEGYYALPSLTAGGTREYSWHGRMKLQHMYNDPVTGLRVRELAAAFLWPTSLTVSTSVPEPAAWALMLTGFFGAGAAIRSRRRAAAGQPGC